MLERHPADFYEPDGPSGRIQKANLIIRQTAKKHKIPLVDIHEILSTKGNIGEKPEGLLRNALIVAANTGRRDLLPLIRGAALDDLDPAVRETAAWAVAELEGGDAP